MPNEALNSQIAETMKIIKTLPAEQQAQLLNLVDETRLRHEHIAQSSERSRNALDDWRLVQKYRVFDMEAQLREARQDA